jgi:methylenetetrahydrofolate reductase (NADPH)
LNQGSEHSLSNHSAKSRISEFMRSYTIEVTPKGAQAVQDFRDHLAPGTWVYVTALSGSNFDDTLQACRKLADQGMTPIPHFTARSMIDAKTLDGHLRQVTLEAGVTRVLAIAGADSQPAGPFADTLSMLETGLFEKHGIRSIGLAAHPEDPPVRDRSIIREHADRKIEFAGKTGIEIYFVTQFVFEAKPVFDFVERIRSLGNTQPLVIGLPGLATLQSLIKHATACGVGPSMQFLTRRARDLRKLLTVQAPDQLVLDLANFAGTHPGANIRGVHIFPLGGFEKSAAWANAVVAGEFEIKSDGFDVNAA